MIVDHAVPLTPYSWDDATLCLDAPGTVTVERVELANPHGGLTLRRFSIRDSGTNDSFNYISDSKTTLTDAGYPEGASFPVSIVCPENRENDEVEPGEPGNPAVSLLGIEVARPNNDQAAYGTGLVVHYRSDGDSKEHFIPFGVMLCPTTSEEQPDCDPPSNEPPR